MPAALPRHICAILLIFLAAWLCAFGSGPARAEYADCSDGYRELAAKPRFRAMVFSYSGGVCYWGWRYSSQKEANRVTLSECRKKYADCRLLDVEADLRAWREQQAKDRDLKLADIKKAQAKLKELGFYSGGIDGKRGPGTIAAIKAYQKSIGFTETGDLNPWALQHLTTSTHDKTDLDICKQALNTARSDWDRDLQYAADVQEAWRRGLSIDSCRIALGLSPRQVGLLKADKQVTTDTPSHSLIAGLTDRALCGKALNSARDDWDPQPDYAEAVAEVKLRHLQVGDCRVTLGLSRQAEQTMPAPVVIQMQPPSQPAAPKDASRLAPTMSLTDICTAALDAGRTAWDDSPGAADARREAERLGITIDVCRLQLGLAAAKPITAEAPRAEKPADPAQPRRLALVVGIDDYQNLPKLRKAVNDSRAVSRELEEIGYDVIPVENPDRRTLNLKIGELQNRLQPGDSALFYFAGHGVALGGENILIPADMPEPVQGGEDLVRDEGFSVDEIVRRIQKQGVKTAFLVLDACRDNPFTASGTRGIGGTRGLTRSEAPNGVFVLYSAGIGQSALDRLSDEDTDPNSVFTRIFLPVIKTGGLTLTGVAKTVQKEVADLAATINYQQQPAYYDQIIGEVVLNSR